MQRRVVIGIVGLAGLGVVGLLRVGRPPVTVSEATDQPIRYRPSSVAQLGATGRPQLVEFFHHA